MTAPIVSHRSAAFLEVYGRIATGLQEVFRTGRDVPFATGSATLVMEMAVGSTVRRDVLNLVCGAFSERWHAISRSLGKRADRLDVPWGRAVDPDLVRRALRRKRYDAVTVVHNETSTGVINPLADIARAVREESDALVLVDAVSSLAGAPVETDGWGLDVVLTGSQKALAAPPGLVPFAASGRAERRAAGVEDRGYYTDLLRYLRRHRKDGTITTPAIPVAWALERQLARIAGEGLEARWRRHRELRDRVAGWLDGGGGARGVTFAVDDPAFRSPTVSCLRPPPGVEAPALVARLADKGFTVAGGYGAWKADTFRIGHMGEVRSEDLDELLAALDETLDDGV
ncbi:MAG: alanine--glyoxylate aminotransferase family protein [Acidobacteriota bacterium]